MCQLLFLNAAQTVIGIRQTMYSVRETDSYAAVCIEILSGDANGRNITISYSTSNGTANGKSQFSLNFMISNTCIFHLQLGMTSYLHKDSLQSQMI